MKKNKVCILGGTGFVGLNIIKKLISMNVQIKIAYRSESDLSELFLLKDKIEFVCINDFFDQSLINSFIEENSFVVNLLYFWDQPEKNKLYIKGLINACEQSKIKRFIHISTAAIYGRVNTCIVNEEVVPNPYSSYAKIKYYTEKKLIEAAKKKNFEIIILRPAAIFGVGSYALKTLVQEYKFNKIKYQFKKILFGDRSMNLVSIGFVSDAVIFCMFKKSRECPEIYNISQDDSNQNSFYTITTLIENTSIQKNINFSNIKVFRSILNLILIIFLYFKRRNVIKINNKFDGSALLNQGFSYPLDFYFELSQYIIELMHERPNSL